MIISKELCKQLDASDFFVEIYAKFELSEREDKANDNLFAELQRRLQFAEDPGIKES